MYRQTKKSSTQLKKEIDQRDKKRKKKWKNVNGVGR